MVDRITKTLDVFLVQSRRAGLLLCASLAMALPTMRAAAEPDTPLDAQAISKQFSKELGAMHDSGKAVGLKKLREQLRDAQPATVQLLAPSGAPLDTRQLYKQCCPSVVIVGSIAKCDKCDDWHTNAASGFVISRDGLIVTNYHVLEGDGKGAAMAVRTFDGRVLPIQKVVAANKRNDLVVLRVEADNLVPLPISPSAPVGTHVYVISHPVKQFYAMTQGIVMGHFLHRKRNEPKGRHVVAITADFAKGSSGGPVLDETGSVVAIVRSTSSVYYDRENGHDTNVQMVWKHCVPSSALIDLLK